MILYQTFMVLLIFCFKTGLGLEEFGCTFDKDYNVQQTNTKEEIMVWGTKNKIIPYNISTPQILLKILRKIADAKKKILYHFYDGTEVTGLFSEFNKKQSHENKSFNIADWEQYLDDQSFEIDSRRDTLGTTKRIFNELFDSVKGDMTLDLERMKKACYFAAVKTKVEGEIFNISAPVKTGFYDLFGVIEVRWNEEPAHFFIHPFLDGLPKLSTGYSNLPYFRDEFFFLKNKGSPNITLNGIIDVIFPESQQPDLEVYLGNPLCSFVNNANLKMKNDPLIIFGKLTYENGFSSYIMASVDGTGRSGIYCKGISKKNKFCIGYLYENDDMKYLVERTFASGNKMSKDEEDILGEVARKMGNEVYPVTLKYLRSKLKEMDALVTDYTLIVNTEGRLAKAARLAVNKLKNGVSMITSCFP